MPIFRADDDPVRRLHHCAFDTLLWSLGHRAFPFLRMLVELLVVSKRGIENFVGLADEKETGDADRHGRDFQASQWPDHMGFFFSFVRSNHGPFIPDDKWLSEARF